MGVVYEEGGTEGVKDTEVRGGEAMRCCESKQSRLKKYE
jgi:hypothetical protein